VLVNNAGRHGGSLLATMSSDAWSGVLAANLDATFHGSPGRVAHHDRPARRPGSPTWPRSARCWPRRDRPTTPAAEAGVVALTQSLAKEVARIGITVNAVCPGYLDTEALAGIAPGRRAPPPLPRCPSMRRFRKPEEVAVAVRFLASAEAAYITGAVLKIDGGILLKAGTAFGCRPPDSRAS
jgi:3-oxoacyl-[acyl-carrier protein] reductase